MSLPALITFASPTSGTNWQSGSTHTVQWSSSGIPTSDNLKIEFYNGSAWSTLINSTLNDGSESVTIPSIALTITNAKIRLTHLNSSYLKESSAFTVLPAAITFVSPTSGTNWQSGSTQTVQWSSIGIPASDNLKIEFYNGSSWSTLINSTPNDGSESITIPSLFLTITNAKIRLTHLNSSYIKESSAFTVNVPKILTITSPQSSTVWNAGASHTITWTSQGMTSSETIKIEYHDGIAWTTVISSTTNDGSHAFTPGISQPNNSSQQIKITLISNTSVNHTVTFSVTAFCSGSGALSPTYSVKTITDGSGVSNYQNNMNCSWTVPKPTNTSHFLVIDVDIDGFEYVNGETALLIMII